MSHAPVWFITGATSGIGAATARAAKALGATVVGTGRDQSRLGALAHEIDLALTVDLDKPRDLEVAIQATLDLYGRIDVLVANAGVGLFARALDTSEEALRRVLETNLVGLVRTVQAVVPQMVAAGCGRVVLVASVAGLRGYPEHAAYCASKHAVVGYGRALAKDLVGTGVGLTLLCPPAVDTPFFDVAGRPELRLNRPRGEMIDAEEVARALLDAVRRGRRQVIIGRRARLLYTLDQLAPSLVDRLQAWKDHT